MEEARAAHDSGAAAVIASKRQLASAQELLREITGDAFDYLARPIEPFELATPDPSSEDRWVDMALQQNLSLVSSRLAADIARENVSAARGGHFPSLDLVASRYKDSAGGDYINANGTPYGSTSLDQYQNVIGHADSRCRSIRAAWWPRRCRQAVYQHRAAKERVERVARQTEHDARDAYLGVLSEISHVKALRRALESNAIALNATESGYEAGTRTAVDVLESRRLWIQAQTDYSRSRYDYMVNMVKLQQAAGILTEQSLSRLERLAQGRRRRSPTRLRTAVARTRPKPPDQPAPSNGSMSSRSRARLPRCASTNSRRHTRPCARGAPASAIKRATMAPSAAPSAASTAPPASISRRAISGPFAV